MKKPRMSARQLVEGMTLTFDPMAAGDLEAIIQFKVSAPDGLYHLRIKVGDCTFHPGQTENPTLTIITPARIWQQISQDEISGQDALMSGLYQVEGDLNLLLEFSRLFNSEKSDVHAPPRQRPGGPIPLSGMAWLQVAFIPWILFWILFNGENPGSGLLPPFLSSLALVLYRLTFARPTYFEVGTLAFFAAAGLLTLARVDWFAQWGSVASSLFIGALWFSSVLFRKMPLCGEYSKWGYVERLWRTSLFIHPNAVISLVWGWQFVLAALLGAAAMGADDYETPLTIARYLLLVPAMIFTIVYQKGADKRFIEDMERSLDRVRFWSGVGLGACGLLSIAACFLPVI